MIPVKKVLAIGYGDIAQRYSRIFCAENHAITAIARSARELQPGVEFIQCDILSERAVELLTRTVYDAVIITLTPSGQTDEDYRKAYLEPIKTLISLWEKHPPPSFVLFVSSSSVYGQSTGEWVDENSLTYPRRYNGKRLLQAENALKRSRLNYCIVRFSGIYGPGRDMLIRQVKNKVLGGDHFTNRIHADDCANILVFLCKQYWQGNLLHRLYLATDSSPSTAKEVSKWLAQEMGFDQDHLTIPSLTSRAGNKRCRNQRLLANGYQFIYPTFKDGYRKELQKDQHKETP